MWLKGPNTTQSAGLGYEPHVHKQQPGRQTAGNMTNQAGSNRMDTSVHMLLLQHQSDEGREAGGNAYRTGNKIRAGMQNRAVS